MTNLAVPERSATRAAQRDFLELQRLIKAENLLAKRPRRYIARCVGLALAIAAGIVAMFVIGHSPWQLAVGAAFGIIFTQAGYLGHDAAHHQVFENRKHNEMMSIIVSNAVVGLSHGWWARKHGRHHANPNTIGRDGDIATGALVFDPDDVGERRGLLGWITRHQGWLFFPMITLEGLNLHVAAIRAVAAGEDIRQRRLEAWLLAGRLILFPALLIAAAGPWWGLGALVVELVVFGVYMGATFAPNHKGMPLIPRDMKVDFLRRQVLTSRNIRGGAFMSIFMGGLNYQIEHHLYPRMPSANLARAREITREFCIERGITYTETGLFASYGIVVRYLNRVGLGHADPFECPMVGQFRPF